MMPGDYGSPLGTARILMQKDPADPTGGFPSEKEVSEEIFVDDVMLLPRSDLISEDMMDEFVDASIDQMFDVSRIAKYNDGVNFCGHLFGWATNVRKEADGIRATLHMCYSDGVTATRRVMQIQNMNPCAEILVGSSDQGPMNAPHQVSNIAELEKLFGESPVQKAMDTVTERVAEDIEKAIMQSLTTPPKLLGEPNKNKRIYAPNVLIQALNSMPQISWE